MQSCSKGTQRIVRFCWELFLFLSACVSVVTTLGVVFILVKNAVPFFKEVSFKHFFLDTDWTPLFYEKKFGILVLLSSTLVTAFISSLISIPIGTFMAIYLSEFANKKLREYLKPIVEYLGNVPTVVYGLFALTYLTPFLQHWMPSLPVFNLLSAGLMMGVMIIPYVCSLVEDAMRAVPMSLREGSIAMGATKLQTTWRVVMPAAFSGITVAYILAISRSFGETMIVAVAGGMSPRFSLNPMMPGETVTTYIVQATAGDASYGTVAYYSVFAAGLVLFFMSVIFSIISYFIRSRFAKSGKFSVLM